LVAVRDRGWSASVELPFDARSVGTAREVLRGLLLAWGHEHQMDDAAVVVSELVTNAVQHADEQGQLRLELQGTGEVLRLELADGSSVRPMAREIVDSDERGRGMHIVDVLTARWGVETHDGGKRVWVELG
jgi:anti-sigma regulatory factor (Ser/Thr protein kinase)